MLRRFWTSALWVATWGLVSACAGKATNYQAAGKQATCAEQCKALGECDDSVDVDKCADDCASNEALSLEGQEVVTVCLEEQECEGTNTVQLLDCIDDGLGGLPPSATGEAFCSKSMDRLADCRGTEIREADRSDCLDAISLLTDDVVSSLNDCAESKKSCETLQLCAGVIALDVMPSDSLGSNSQVFMDLVEQLVGAPLGGGSE
jgi:hypothetical protein